MCLHESYWMSKDSDIGDDGCETHSCHCKGCGTILSFRVKPEYVTACVEKEWNLFKQADRSNHVLKKGDEDDVED